MAISHGTEFVYINSLYGCKDVKNMPFFSKIYALFLFMLLILMVNNTLTAQKADSLKRYEYTYPGMGSLFRIVAYTGDSAALAKACRLAFNKIDSLNLILSDYLSYSEIMELSRTAGSGKFQPVSDDLFKVISLSKRWAERSDGTFDITIGAVTQLWRRAAFIEEYPEDNEIEKALEKVDYRLIKLDSSNQSVLLEKEGMMLDAGGIAKGYALDQVFQILNRHGFEQCLIDGAGDIRVGAPPPGKKGWPIAMEGLSGIDSTLMLTHKAIATSGDLYRFIEVNGMRYSHIIDPETGYGLTVSRTVTVVADTGTEADVLASIFSVTGAVKGKELEENFPPCRVLIMEKRDDEIVSFEFGKHGPGR